MSEGIRIMQIGNAWHSYVGRTQLRCKINELSGIVMHAYSFLGGDAVYFINDKRIHIYCPTDNIYEPAVPIRKIISQDIKLRYAHWNKIVQSAKRKKK